MTRPGERSALEPDLVPLHSRIRELHLRHPDGPIPSAAVKSLRDAAMAPRPGSRDLLQDRTLSIRKDREAARKDRQAAQAALADMVRSAAACADDDLERLGHRLRGLRYHWSLRFESDTALLGLDPEQMRTIALHLLRKGVTGLEVLIGLDLLAPVVRDDDVGLVCEIALLQRSFAFAATKALRGATDPARALHWLAVRTPPQDRYQYADSLARLPGEAADALLETLSAAETVTLVRMMSNLPRTPAWFKGNRRLAASLAAASADSRHFGEHLAGLAAIAQLRDDLRYGHSSRLEFEPGQGAEIAESLRAMLLELEAGAAVAAALKRHPHDSETIWLHRQIAQALTEAGDFPSGLAIRVAVPAPDSGQDARTQVLVDGVPLVERMFDQGLPDSPERVLHRRGGLRAASEPHEVWIAEADCTEGCCGALRAEISRDVAAGTVVWDVGTTRGPDTASERFVFDADAYDAEVARAEADHSWEWPARRAARLLDERLRAEPELLAHWECRLLWTHSWNGERSRLQLVFSHPGDLEFSLDRPWLQFMYTAEIPDAAVVDHEAVDAVVDQVVERFRETDPKTLAKVCGGSREHAEALGYAWDPRL